MKQLIVSLLVLSLSACGGGGGGGNGACSDLNLRVFGGEQCKYSASPVVPLYAMSASGTPLGVCSGTLVTIDDVLTAAHCIELSTIPGSVGVFVYADEKLIPIVSGRNHPNYNGETGSPYDLAMVTIAEPVNIGPVPLLLSDMSQVGEEISVFGYGLNENPENSPEDLRAARLTISDMWPGGFAASFDDSSASICQGDSGGPVTQTINGVTSLIGVTSFTLNGCNSGSHSGFVDIQYPELYNFILGYAADITVR